MFVSRRMDFLYAILHGASAVLRSFVYQIFLQRKRNRSESDIVESQFRSFGFKTHYNLPVSNLEGSGNHGGGVTESHS